MKKFLILAGVAILIILAIIILIMVAGCRQTAQLTSINIITDKLEYEAEEVLKVKIENNSKKSICFSSCYPYYLEKKTCPDAVEGKEEKWETYSYIKCLTDNLIERCVIPEEVKTFELILPLIDKGCHRLAVPVCVECNINETFREDKRFYSDEFIIR